MSAFMLCKTIINHSVASHTSYHYNNTKKLKLLNLLEHTRQIMLEAIIIQGDCYVHQAGQFNLQERNLLLHRAGQFNQQERNLLLHVVVLGEAKLDKVWSC
jgi:hypothetical protein